MASKRDKNLDEYGREPGEPEPIEDELEEEAALGEDSLLDTDALGTELEETALGGPDLDPEAQAPGDARMRGGDPDASKLDASFVGEEAPGSSNPTPDQDVVDDIGVASGVTYSDTEPLRPEKINARDENRYELNPASSDDYPERDWERELETEEQLERRLRRKKHERPPP